jgi:hypothetical protein
MITPMPRSRRIFVVVSIVVVAIFAIVSVALYRKSSTESRLRKLDLLEINVRNGMFRTVHNRWPRDEAELASMKTNTWPPAAAGSEDKAMQRLAAGEYRLVPRIKREGKFDFDPPPELLIAYEAQVTQRDGLAIFADGEVRRITTAQLTDHLEKARVMQAETPSRDVGEGGVKQQSKD